MNSIYRLKQQIKRKTATQQVYNCKCIVIIQIQPVMKHENLGKPLQSILHVKRKSNMKFAFSNSSKVLPKQHANAQFMCLVEQKKNYQSMIKDQINKLQLKDTNVSDPEVEPFCSSNEDLNSDLKTNQYYKLELKNGTSLLLNAKIQKSIKSVRLNKQIDRYLEQKIDTNCLKILERARKNTIIKSFFQSLKLSHGMLNKYKAARFFEYQKLTRKSFLAIFRFANEIFCISEGVKQNELILKTFIIRRSLKKFIETMKIQILIKQSKNYAKKKQLRTKKLYFHYFKHQINSEKCIIQNISILQKQRKIKTLQKFVELWKCKTKIEQKKENLMLKRQKDYFIYLVMKMKQNKQERNDKFHNFLVEYEQIYQNSQIQYNQHQLQNYAKNKKMSSKSKQKIKTQIKLKVLTRKVNANEKSRRGQQFLKLLKSHKNIQLVKNLHSLHHKLLTYKNSFIFQFISVTQHQKKISKIFTLNLLRYLRNFRKNISNDLKYKKSLASVTGTKRWLIRNKHIFKSQPFKQSEGNACKFRTDLGSEASVEFWNPISQKSQIDLIKQSKFKTLREIRQKKQFIKTLKQRMVKKKKQQVLQYGYKQIRDRRTIKKVWENWKDKQKMGQVLREIDEEAAHQQNEEQNKLCEQVKKRIMINNKKRLFERLCQGYKYLLSNRKLSFSRQEKLKTIFLLKLRSIRTIRQINDQKIQKLVKVSQRRYQFEWKKLARLLRQNLLMRAIQEQKYRMIIGKQLQSKKEKSHDSKKSDRQYEKKPQKKQVMQNYIKKAIGLIRKVDKRYFMRLLKANYQIAKGSIKVTSIYVSHIFCQMIANKSRLKVIKQMKFKEQQLEKIMRIKLLKQSLNKIKMNHKNSATIGLTASITLNKKRDKLNDVLKVLSLYQNTSKLNKQKMKKMNEITKNHWTIEKRKLFVKLKSIFSKRKQTQVNELELNVDNKIVQENNIKQNGFQKYLNKQMNQGDHLQHNQSQSQQSQNQFQLRNQHNFEKSASNKQFIEQHSEQQIPYQKYRKSYEIEKIPTQYQSVQQFEITTPHSIGEPMQQTENKFHSSGQNQQIDNQESYLANQYDYKYLANRNNLNVLKRYFVEWKLMAKQKQLEHEQILKRAFNGLRMYTKQKSLVKKYLMQYEQQMHYYPHSAQEYQQFRTVVQNS